MHCTLLNCLLNSKVSTFIGLSFDNQRILEFFSFLIRKFAFERTSCTKLRWKSSKLKHMWCQYNIGNWKKNYDEWRHSSDQNLQATKFCYWYLWNIFAGERGNFQNSIFWLVFPAETFVNDSLGWSICQYGCEIFCYSRQVFFSIKFNLLAEETL